MRVALLIALFAIGAGGCASAGEESRDWVAEREAATGANFPNLRDVPTTHDANTDAAHWAALQEDLLAAGQAVRDNPRSAPAAAADDPAAFLADAERALESAREAHTP
jgi:hypothetical protein